MSIAVNKMKFHLSTQNNDFSIRKISGLSNSTISADGKHVDVELRELRHGERKEILVELELDLTSSPNGSTTALSNDLGEFGVPRKGTGSTRSLSRQGSIVDSTNFGESMYASSGSSRMIEEVPMLELDCSFSDPSASKACTRLAKPVLLVLMLVPPTSSNSVPSSNANPIIARRRLEIMASDMMTRSLVLVSKGRFDESQRLMGETRRALSSVIESVVHQLNTSPVTSGYAPAGGKRERRDALNRETLITLEAILKDIDIVLEGLDEDSRVFFERDQRNFGAQQVRLALSCLFRSICSSLSLFLLGHGPSLAEIVDVQDGHRAPLLHFGERHRPGPAQRLGSSRVIFHFFDVSHLFLLSFSSIFRISLASPRSSHFVPISAAPVFFTSQSVSGSIICALLRSICSIPYSLFRISYTAPLACSCAAVALLGSCKRFNPRSGEAHCAFSLPLDWPPTPSRSTSPALGASDSSSSSPSTSSRASLSAAPSASSSLSLKAFSAWR